MSAAPSSSQSGGDPRAEFYEQAYRESNTIWDAGRPQPALATLLAQHEIDTRKTVLEVGCGRAEHLLMMAQRGLTGVGIDSSQHAIREATEKAAIRGLSDRVAFKVLDYRLLSTLGHTFDIIIDCAFSHILSLDQRPVYANTIRQVIRPGGHVYILSYSGKAVITSQMIKDRVVPQQPQTQAETGTGTGTGTGTSTEPGITESEKKQDQQTTTGTLKTPHEFVIPSGMTEHDIHMLYPSEKGWRIDSIQNVWMVADTGEKIPCLLSVISYAGESGSGESASGSERAGQHTQ